MADTIQNTLFVIPAGIGILIREYRGRAGLRVDFLHRNSRIRQDGNARLETERTIPSRHRRKQTRIRQASVPRKNDG